jgi:hypothetical protein
MSLNIGSLQNCIQHYLDPVSVCQKKPISSYTDGFSKDVRHHKHGGLLSSPAITQPADRAPSQDCWPVCGYETMITLVDRTDESANWS